MRPALLILAAGMSSRYGKLKQTEPVGLNGQRLIDYSVHDALHAGFGKLVFVIRPEIEKEFRNLVGRHWEGAAEVRYVHQRTKDATLARTFAVPRRKPWGTGHAILAARHAIHEAFGVINSDDYYGPQAFRMLVEHLRCAPHTEYALIGFRLRQTLSPFGAVTRAICSCDSRGYLKAVAEIDNIIRCPGGALRVGPCGSITRFTGAETASLNMWGFSPRLFPLLAVEFRRFLRQHVCAPDAEFDVSYAINQLLNRGRIRVRIVGLSTGGYGINFPADKQRVATRLQKRRRPVFSK